MRDGESKSPVDFGIDSNNTKLALYRKYRPTSLDQVIGQPQVTDILQAAAKDGRFAHAYLFTGQRGTGKTTVARILAHLVNQIEYKDNMANDNIDIIEIDAASNNGVDDVREIRDNIMLRPMASRYKVFIIDEFHMLSKAAFNALLKTIEEPPEYIVFILATTELSKVPDTILSRVQRFTFRPLSSEVLANHILTIAKSENIEITESAAQLIANSAGGSVRDAITLLDQLSNYPEINDQLVRETLNLVPITTIDKLVNYIRESNLMALCGEINQLLGEGIDAVELSSQLVDRLMELAPHEPKLYSLAGELLDVMKAAVPKVKLMAVLTNYLAKDKELVHQPVLPAKIENKTVTPTPPIKKPALVVKANSTKSTADKTVGNFVWSELLQQLIDGDFPSTHSLLRQSDYRYDQTDNTLTLFFNKDFFRKQAKSANFQKEIADSFMVLYNTKPIIVISDQKIPVDSDVQAVLDIVGGEVTKINDQI